MTRFSKYLPWFAVGGEGQAITVAQLLYQESGLTELAGVQATLLADSPDALEQGVRKLSGERLATAPGSQWAYSNLNYDVLGLLIQQVSGQSYESYIQEHIFTPLDMGHSYTSLAAARAGGAASGYVQFFGRPLAYDRWMPYTRATLPAAGLWSSASDLSHYLMAQLDGGRYAGKALLSPAGIQKLHTPGTWFKNGGGYSMGWFYWPGFLDPRYQPEDGLNYTNLPTVYHDGDWANYKAVVLMLPSQDYGLALLLNSNDLPIRSVFTYFAWDLTLIATGGEPQFFQPREDVLLHYSRWLGAGLVLVLLLEFLLAFGGLRRMRARAYRVDFPLGRLLLQAGLPLLLDAAVSGFFFWGLFPRHAVSLPIVIRTMPDLGLLSILALLLAVVWGALRSLWYLRAWALARRTRR